MEPTPPRVEPIDDSPGWLWLEDGDDVATVREASCGIVIALKHKASGERGAVYRRCESMRCKRCARERIEVWYDAAVVRFATGRVVYFARIPVFGQTLWDRLRKRINRAGGDFIRVSRSDGSVLLFSSVDFAGADVATKKVTPANAARLLEKVGFRLPGLAQKHAVRGGGRWEMPNARHEGKGDWSVLSLCGPRNYERILEEERRLYELQGGRRWDQRLQRPSDLPPNQEVALFMRAYESMMNRSSQIQEEPP